MKKFFDILSLIITLLVILFLLWTACSWYEVVTQNMHPVTPIYSEWNIFKMFIKFVS